MCFSSKEEQEIGHKGIEHISFRTVSCLIAIARLETAVVLSPCVFDNDQIVLFGLTLLETGFCSVVDETASFSGPYDGCQKSAPEIDWIIDLTCGDYELFYGLLVQSPLTRIKKSCFDLQRISEVLIPTQQQFSYFDQYDWHSI
jgi:hypothetical protein